MRNYINKIIKKEKKVKKIETKFILISFLLFSLLNVIVNPISYAEEEIEQQQEEFKIQDFIEESKKYSKEFFGDMDVGEVLNNAIKGEVDNKSIIERIFNLFGSEIGNISKSLVSILVIIIIHSILKSVSESLENETIGKIIYYVQYILIITIIMGNFSEIVKLVQETANNLVGFMNILIPLLMALMIYTGSITTSTVLEPIILFITNFIGNMIQNIIIPLILVTASLIIISKISDKIQVEKLAKFLKSGIVWFLGIVLTIFVGIVSLEGTMSSSVDGITAKTTKAVVSSAVPVVRKDIRRRSRHSIRFRNSIKKCSRNSRCNYNNRNMYSTNNKTWNINNNV